jgi:hypothetical protein
VPYRISKEVKLPVGILPDNMNIFAPDFDRDENDTNQGRIIIIVTGATGIFA